MSRGKKRTAEQIISKLHEAEVTIFQGQTAAVAAKSIGVTAQTYFRWRKEYGGLPATAVPTAIAPCVLSRTNLLWLWSTE